MRILHISADFPDPLRPGKTRAVANLLDLAPGHDHAVYSINRVTGLAGIAAIRFGPGRTAVAYAAPPKGVLLAARLAALADWIIADTRRAGLTPDLVHAHKLSVEALAGERVARALGVPLVVSCQGNSDLRILTARPDLRPRWRRLWREAAVVLPFAPWTAQALTDLLGPRSGPLHCLPCPTPADAVIAPRMTPPRILSVFGLDDMANKNAALLVEAVRRLRAAGTPVELLIAGTGAPAARDRLGTLLADLPFARALGPVAHADVQALMNASAVLAVPSRRESYGMVFAEALLAGCPVLHGRRNGIAGYFPGAPFAVEAPEGGAADLTRTLGAMIREQAPRKAALAEAQRTGRLADLRRPAIAALYGGVLAAACHRPAWNRAA